MYGDILYCVNCERTFKDTEAIHDTRKENIQINCPYCSSNNIRNISEAIEVYEKSSSKSSVNLNLEKTIIYNKFKKLQTKYLKRQGKVLIQEDIFYPRNIIKRWKEHDKLYKSKK